ncbi:MAG: hypothetical protein CVV25_02045 [Ignavibacteriae bacterium HGW-Ignavibacteriae-4]|jgi:hypothetical protein|nr:MAG: hypothetical protein CVV25_02045 [Ignavibacteriae bacterium HGW-Ignavibacteriae-4]
MKKSENKMEYYIFLGLIIGILIFLTNFIYEKWGRKIEKLNKKLGTQLIDNGFLDFADSFNLDELRSKLINSFNIYEEENHRIVQIDAEELAEFGFDFFLPKLQKILAKRNFDLNVRTAEDYENSNDIFINDEKIKLYTKEEMEKDTFWDSGARNFFKKVNELMLIEGIKEKFYLLYDDNDLAVLLLTEKQYRVIKHRYFDKENEQPYLP